MSTINTSTSAGRIAGRVALISGGAQGIGREIAALFQREGACVFILDCDVSSGHKTAAELTRQDSSLPVKYLSANLREPAAIQNAVDCLRRDHGRVDILVNNAGV